MNEVEHGPLRDPTHTEDISSSYLSFPSYAVSLNIRESSRIIGDYTVTFENVIHERNFPDVVCRWRSNYDTHLPTSANQSDQAQDWVGILGLWRRPIMGSIPYRSFLPAGVENILVAAMAYFTDHDALIGGRMQPDMEHLGEAAGIAAAMASKLNIPPRKLPIKRLQKELVKQGVLRGKDVPDVKVKNVPSLDELHRQDFWRAERESVFPPSKEGQRLSPEEAVKLLGTDKAPDGMLELYLSGKKAVPLLRPLLYSKNRSIHEEVAVLLGLLGDRMAVPALMEFLQERNTRRFVYKLPLASKRASVPLYWTSIILLGRFEEASAVPELLKILPESPADLPGMQRNHYGSDMFKDISICPPPLVSFIIVALGRIGDKSAVESIKPFLAVSAQPDINRENRDFELAWAISTNAAWSLARLGDHSGVPALIDLLSSEQALVRNYAAGLLEKITGQKFGNDRNAWKQWLVNK